MSPGLQTLNTPLYPAGKQLVARHAVFIGHGLEPLIRDGGMIGEDVFDGLLHGEQPFVLGLDAALFEVVGQFPGVDQQLDAGAPHQALVVGLEHGGDDAHDGVVGGGLLGGDQGASPGKSAARGLKLVKMGESRVLDLHRPANQRSTPRP